MIHVRVGPEDFDVGHETERIAGDGAGGVATFVGVVRGGDGLVSMTLEHYPAMTERALQALAEGAVERWPLTAVTIIHRIGELIPGDRIVFVGTASAHRAAVLESCAYLIDRLKTDAPFWKSECFTDGRAKWVDAREADNKAAARWAQVNAL